MNTDTDQLPIQFDPDQLREEIKRLTDEATRLRQRADSLQRRAGLYDALLQEAAKLNDGRAGEPPAEAPFKDMTIADAAYEVLRREGGKLGGRKILRAVEDGGKTVGGKAPMGTLSTSMKRDERIERVPGETNMWRLKDIGREVVTA